MQKGRKEDESTEATFKCYKLEPWWTHGNGWIKRYSTRREMSCYPIWEKVLMGIHMQCKIILKMEGDGWESIIYTAREMNTTVRIIIIVREYNLWAGDSSLCQFKWNRASMKGPWKKYARALSISGFSNNIFHHVWSAAQKELQVI